MEREYKPLPDLRDHERIAWDMYFATMCGMSMHPDAIARGQALSIQRCAELSDRMITERRKR